MSSETVISGGETRREQLHVGADDPADVEAVRDGRGRIEGGVSIDMTFEILKNQRRRWVLRYLNERAGPVTLSELSEHVAALENGKTVDQLSSQERKRVYVGLYQCHLPKMADMGFIEFNKNRGIIELGPAAVYANEYLYASTSPELEWPRYYLGVVGLGWLLFGISAVAGTLLVPTTVFLLFLLVVTTVAVFHHRTTKGGDATGSPIVTDGSVELL